VDEQTKLSFYRKCYSVYSLLAQVKPAQFDNLFPIPEFSSIESAACLENGTLNLDDFFKNARVYLAMNPDATAPFAMSLFPSLFAEFVTDWHVAQAIGLIHRFRSQRTPQFMTVIPQLCAQLFLRNFTFTNSIVDRFLLKLANSDTATAQLLFAAFCANVYRLSPPELSFLSDLPPDELRGIVSSYLIAILPRIQFSAALVGASLSLANLAKADWDVTALRSLLHSSRAPIAPPSRPTVFLSANDSLLFNDILSHSSPRELPFQRWFVLQKLTLEVASTAGPVPSQTFEKSLRTTEEIAAAQIALGCVIREAVFNRPISSSTLEFRGKLEQLLGEAVSVVLRNAGIRTSIGSGRFVQTVLSRNLVQTVREFGKDGWSREQENTVRLFSPLLELLCESHVFMMELTEVPKVADRPLFLVNPKWEKIELKNCEVPRLIAREISWNGQRPGLAFFAVRELAAHLKRERRAWNEALDARKWLFSLAREGGCEGRLKELLLAFLHLLMFLEQAIGDWGMWTGRDREALLFMNLAMPRVLQPELSD
jgi:hypothetical protein